MGGSPEWPEQLSTTIVAGALDGTFDALGMWQNVGHAQLLACFLRRAPRGGFEHNLALLPPPTRRALLRLPVPG